MELGYLIDETEENENAECIKILKDNKVKFLFSDPIIKKNFYDNASIIIENDKEHIFSSLVGIKYIGLFENIKEQNINYVHPSKSNEKFNYPRN